MDSENLHQGSNSVQITDESNVSSLNSTNGNGLVVDSRVAFSVRAAFSVACVVLVFFNVSAIFILLKTKKIPFTIKIFACSLLTSDGLVGLTYVLHSILIYVPGIDVQAVYQSMGDSIRSLVLVSCISVTVLSLERLVILKNPILHSKLFTENLVFTMVALTWGLGLTTSMLLSYVVEKPDWKQSCISCSNERLHPAARVVIVVVVFVCQLVVFVSCVAILKIVIKQVTQIHTAPVQTNTKRKSTVLFTGTCTVCVILGSYLICFVPNTIYQIMELLNIFERRVVIKNVLYFFTLINSFSNPVVYVWRFKEARLRLFELLSFVPAMEGKVIALRSAVYDNYPDIAPSIQTSQVTNTEQCSTNM